MMTNAEVLTLTDALCTAPVESDAAVWSDKLFRLLEVAVRTLDCELAAAQAEVKVTELPLEKDAEFPLPDALAPAAAYLAAYLAGGASECKLGYERALEGYLLALGVTLSPIGDKYRF